MVEVDGAEHVLVGHGRYLNVVPEYR
jgi:hypothetical protein